MAGLSPTIPGKGASKGSGGGPLSELGRLPRDSSLMQTEQVGRVALAHAITHSQSQNEQLVFGELSDALAGSLAKGLVPVATLGVRQREGQIILGQGLNAGAVAELRYMPVLKNPNEPGHQWPLAVVTFQHRQRAFRVGHEEMGPEFGDRVFLPLFVSWIKAHGPCAQGIDQQTIDSA